MKVSAKRKDTGKWWIFGNIKTREYEGKEQQQLSFKVTPEFKAFMEDALQGEWINFALFPDDEPKPRHTGEAGVVAPAKLEEEPPVPDDEIPF